MELKFNVTGARRKKLVMTISETLNTAPEYKGPPTFAYEVGGYRIDRFGTVTGKDNLDLEDALHQKGFSAEEREYDEPDTYESGLGRMGATTSIEELSDPQAWAEREMRRMNLENQNVPDYSNRGQCSPDPDSLFTIEMPLDGFTETALENLERLIAGKATLIKKAIGADDLPVERTETTLRFPWFRFGIEPEEVNAYARFIGALCAMAKKQQRVTATEKAYDNEKYAFRCFLLRLGFIGPEYKEERKVLLSKLTGSAAFKNVQRNSEEETEA